MLPAAYRLRSAADFAAVTRGGRKARSGDMVVYFMPADPATPGRRASDKTPAGLACSVPPDRAKPRAGLIVSRKVGGSVVRHRVSRRLRAQLAPRLPALPAGSRLVVRALPAAAEASSARLARQLDAAFDRFVPRAGVR
ncbi:MAG TPA: ribonuclease P protein component [Jatrophihabitans sp.]|nr:ribonuclease P protein component [Jatrophihabitans sp.]